MRPVRKVKKLIAVSIIGILMCMFFMPSGYIYGDGTKTAYWPVLEGEPYGKSAILIEQDTGAVLYSKNPDEKLYPASITKIMTGLLAVENLNMEDTVTVTADMLASLPGDAAIQGVVPGETMKIKDCMYSLMMRSNNDIAVVLAHKVAGSEEAFAAMMTERAHAIGAVNTNFVNASGLHNENHYTTARDMALITKAAISNPTFSSIWGTEEYTLPATNISSAMTIWHRHNMLVSGRADYYQYATGGKTGYTDEAGRTLVTCAEKDSIKLISVVMFSNNDYIFNDTKNLLNYGFNNFEKLTIRGNEERFGQSKGSGYSVINELYGSEVNMLTIGNGSVVIPKGVELKNMKYDLDMDIVDTGRGEIAKLTYVHESDALGSAVIYLSSSYESSQGALSSLEREVEKTEKTQITEIFSVNIYYIAGGAAAIIIIVFIIRLNIRRRKRRIITKNYFLR